MKNRSIAFNALTTVLQVIFTGIVYFFLYRMLINKVGASLLGVWSIVLVTVSLANLGNFGITSGLVKFVAECSISNEKNNLEKLIFTALVSTTFLYGICCVFIYFLSNFILNKFIEREYLEVAKLLIPYSLTSLFLNGCASVFLSIIDGFEKNYLKNFFIISGNLLLVTTTYLLIDKKGIYAVAIAQNIQVVFVFVCSFLTSLYIIKKNFLSKWNWDTKIFKKISIFGFKFQLISITQMLYEPITKILLGKYSSMSVVGYYEMSSRLIAQIRGVISNANQVVVPIISKLPKSDSKEESFIYKKTITLVYLAGFIAFAGVIFFSISISNLWIGTYNVVFVKALIVLSIANFINLLCGPAYFNLLGRGELTFILLIHVLIGVSNFLLGFLLGKINIDYGVIMGWAISLALGSTVLIYFYQKAREITFFETINQKNLYLMIALFVLSVFYLIYSKEINDIFTKQMMIIVSAIGYLFFTITSLYFNLPAIKSLLKVLKPKY
jgi:O-antigen/teichoic acid export membrane protein